MHKTAFAFGDPDYAQRSATQAWSGTGAESPQNQAFGLYSGKGAVKRVA
jgi:hypothetical protein